ncbi:DUF3971 domain-containing protein [Maribacter sp.]|nr:DUF3971 domain-containing protein [Maribacter sp.]
MKKKILKIIGIVLVVVVGLLIAAPFVLEAKIGDLIRNNVNNNVNATLDFSEANLSLLASFPNAEVSLENTTLITNAPFEGDTLLAAKHLSLKMGISELFKSANDPIGVKNLSLDGATIHVKVNEEELANYEIGKDSGSTEAKPEATDGFTLDLQSYEITDTEVIYDDRAAKVYLVVSDIQHKGTGDLSASTSELDTHTEALVTFVLDSTNYLNKNSIKLDALIGIDLKEDKYTFLKNEAVVNQLPLVFDGFVKVNENSQEIDISFKTPSSDFKNFLAVIPAEYSKNIENVKTTGDFTVAGKFNGIVDETHIPKFDIKINSENASFKYPDLPKSVRNVFIDVDMVNATGIAEDTYVNIDRLSFMIDEDKFNMVSKITELMGNTKVNAHIDGNMNLANISKAYPVPEDLNLKGLLNADVTTSFDMASIEKEQYENTKTSGMLKVADFEYSSPEIPNPVRISAVGMTFNPTTVSLNELNGTTGTTDFSAKGTINNLLGFLFNDENVEGNFDLSSNTFALSDFMVSEDVAEDGSNSEEKEKTPTTSEEKIKIPSFLDANINVLANTVLYDNLELKNVKGNLRIKDEKATLNNMTSSMFEGKMSFNGEVSTKNDTPTFAMKLGLDKVEVGESFKAIELFKTLAPIAKILQGKMDSDIELSGNLTDDFSPDLLSLSGDLLANIFTREIDAKQTPILSALDTKLDFVNLKELNLDALKTTLSFKDGLVSVKPFAIKYQDVTINIAGGHTFDQKLNYKATMEVPAKYLGSEVTSLIAKIGEDELQELTIPVTANIGGDYASPQVTTDMSSGVKSLTSKLIEIQKQKLINKGKDKATDLLKDVLGGGDKNDSTKTATDQEKVKDILGGILGNKSKDSTKTKTDSVPPKKEEDVVKEKAEDILGGLFGNKKKKTDSVKKN